MRRLFHVSLFVLLSAPVIAGERLLPIGSPVGDSGPVRGGCIANRHIERVRFVSSSVAVIDYRGGHRLSLTLSAPCPGIRTEGYVHKPVNNRFCEGDLLRVINRGSICTVAAIAPLDGEDDNLRPAPEAD